MPTCENLKALRKRNGFTQTELAERVGTSERSIKYFEAGLRNPSLTTLIRLAENLNCSLDEIVGRKEINSSPVGDK